MLEVKTLATYQYQDRDYAVVYEPEKRTYHRQGVSRTSDWSERVQFHKDERAFFVNLHHARFNCRHYLVHQVLERRAIKADNIQDVLEAYADEILSNQRIGVSFAVRSELKDVADVLTDFGHRYPALQIIAIRLTNNDTQVALATSQPVEALILREEWDDIFELMKQQEEPHNHHFFDKMALSLNYLITQTPLQSFYWMEMNRQDYQDFSHHPLPKPLVKSMPAEVDYDCSSLVSALCQGFPLESLLPWFW